MYIREVSVLTVQFRVIIILEFCAVSLYIGQLSKAFFCTLFNVHGTECIEIRTRDFDVRGCGAYVI
jgi:hypothetical protein